MDGGNVTAYIKTETVAPIGRRYGKRVGLAILAYKAPETTRASIENHRQHGLYDLFDDVVVCFQSVSDADLAMAKACGVRAVGRSENLGIQSGFRWAWECLDADYTLILENDIPVCVSPESMRAQLETSLRLLEEGEVDLVRLRNRFNPGEQNRFASMYSRFWPLRDIDPRWHDTEMLDRSPAWKKALRRLLRPGKATRQLGPAVDKPVHADFEGPLRASAGLRRCPSVTAYSQFRREQDADA